MLSQLVQTLVATLALRASAAVLENRNSQCTSYNDDFDDLKATQAPVLGGSRIGEYHGINYGACDLIVR